MKTVLFILFSFLLPLTVFPQIIVQNPRIGFSNTESIIISQIEINSRETILTFKTMMSPGSRFGISGKSFIKVVGQSDTLFLTKQDAPIPVDGWITVPPEGITYKLYFPPIDSAAFKIDFGELHDSSWYMYDIELGDQPHNSIVPIELLGDWFSEESGKWTFSFWDSIAIVNSKIWDYFSVVMDNENYKVILENNGDKLYILYKKKDDGLSQISINDNQSFKPYTKDVSVLTKSLDEDMDYKSSGDSGVVVYQGIFKGYRPEFGSYCSLEVGDGLKSNRDYYAFEIDTNGSFRVELKVDAPQKVTIFMQTGRENIFVVPDKNLFHLINTGINGFTSFYMGPGASISLRSNLIDEWSKDYNIQNRVNELNKDEFLNLIFKADFLELEKIKNPIFKNMKQKHEMFFIPRRSVRYLELGRSVVIGVDSFWISNEVTNKEYRKFAMDIINNPDQVLKWEEAGRNPTTGIYERNIELELYSEISKHLVDSTCVVNILYKGEELEIGIDEYLNGKKFNDYPVLGIPIEGVEYYIKWLNQKYLPTDGFLYRLPGEMDYRIVKDYVNEVYNYKETKSDFHGVIKAPDDTLAFLFANAPEWTLKSKVFRDPTDRENKNIVIGDWSEQGDSIVATNDGIESGGFRLIRRARELGKRKSDHTQIFIALFVLFVIILIGVLIWRVRIKWNLNKEIRLRRVRELELTAIRSQMNPHFLFNSLNSVQNLIQQNKGREAHLYLSDFAGLIRKVLRNSEKEEVSIAEELEMVEQYLNLEKLRFDFEFTILVGEGIDAQNTMIPSMLLQPFAENAVIHGLQNKPSDRKLKIEVLKTEGGIIIVLEDNGIGREEARKVAAEKNGKGIKMNKERMELLREKYGEKYRLEIIDLERGTKVEIIIPEEN